MDDNPAFVAAIVASNYSPESGALAAAAHSRNRKVIYANHAQVPCNSPFLPPVLADCSVFYGTIVRDTYERLSRCNTHATYIGQPGKFDCDVIGRDTQNHWCIPDCTDPQRSFGKTGFSKLSK